MSISIYFIKILLFFIVISLLFLRPMALGNEYSSYGITFLSIFSLSIYLLSGGEKIKENNFKIFKIIFYSCSILALVYLFQGNLIEEKGVLMALISSFMSMLFLNDDNRKRIFFNIYTYFILALCLSSILTYILSYPNDYNSYILKVLHFKRNQYTFVIFFPFSVIYRLFQTNVISLPRFTHFFIEPGIAPCFITSVIILVLNNNNGFLKYFKIIILLCGLILTFSTSLVPTLGLGLLLYYLSKNKKKSAKNFLGIIVIGITTYLLFLRIPYFGFLDKSLTHGSSFDDRIFYWKSGIKDISIYVSAFVNIYMVYKIGLLKKSKNLFYAIFLPLLFTGFVNVVWLTTSYIIFMYYDNTDN